MATKADLQSAPAGAIALDDLDTVEGMAARYPQLLTVPTLRWQLRHRDSNGLAVACLPLGRKLLISRSRYEAWLATRAGSAK